MIRQFGLLLAVGIAVICFASIIVPLATLGIREYKSPTKAKDFREGVPRPAHGLARQPAAVGRPGAGRRQLRRVLRRPRRRGQDHAAERPGPVGQPELAGHQGLPHGRGTRPARAPSSASSSRATTCSRKETVNFVSATDASATSTSTPSSSSARRAWSPPMDYLIEVPGARRSSTRPPEDVRGGYDVAPEDIRLSTVALANAPADRAGSTRTAARRAERDLPLRPRLARGAQGHRQRHPRHDRSRPRASGPPRRVWPSSASGLLENLTANRALLTYLVDPVRRPVPRLPAAERRAVAAVAGAGADRGRRRQPRGLGPRPQAQPDDRGRRSARGRRLHRVHVADPAALPRGAAPGPAGRGRRSTWPRRAPAGPSSCRASPPCPASP